MTLSEVAKDIFLITDQPTTCGLCGSRTQFAPIAALAEYSEMHTCLNSNCGYVFVLVEE
jgi:hypothetical protein